MGSSCLDLPRLISEGQLLLGEAEYAVVCPDFWRSNIALEELSLKILLRDVAHTITRLHLNGKVHALDRILVELCRMSQDILHRDNLIGRVILLIILWIIAISRISDVVDLCRQIWLFLVVGTDIDNLIAVQRRCPFAEDMWHDFIG